MNAALDLGADSLRLLYRRGDQLLGKSCRSVYAVLPDSESRRRMLQQASIPYATCEDHLVLMGANAADSAQLFQTPCRALLPGGLIPREDPLARQVLAFLIENLLPSPQSDEDVCCLTFPGAGDRNALSTYQEHDLFFAQVVRLKGYRPSVLSSGMAVALAELGQDSLTGIGITLGAETCQISLAHHGIEMARCTLGRGGNWIDEQLALDQEAFAWDARGNRYLDLEQIKEWKEKWNGSLVDAAGDSLSKRLKEIYRQLLTDLLVEFRRVVDSTPQVQNMSRPLKIVCNGGPAQIPGFREQMEESLTEIDWPFEIEGVHLADDSSYGVARGCLINAELEAGVQPPEIFAA